MAYSTDTREMVLSYLDKGHTYEEAWRELGVGISTIKDMEETTKRNRQFRKAAAGEVREKIPFRRVKGLCIRASRCNVRRNSRTFWRFYIWRF